MQDAVGCVLRGGAVVVARVPRRAAKAAPDAARRFATSACCVAAQPAQAPAQV